MSTAPSRRSPLLIALLFGGVGLFYAPSLRNDFVYDDYQLIVEEPAPRTLMEIGAVFFEPHCPQLPYYRPLVRGSILLQRLLHGDRPALFQAVNLCLAGAIAVFAYVLLRAPAFGIGRGSAALAALVFSVHPAASSSVYSISSGREALAATLFTLAALAAFLRPGRRYYALAILALVGGLLSKEQAVVIPVLFLAADISGAAAGAPREGLAAWARRYAPVAIVVLLYFGLRWTIFRGVELRGAVAASSALPALSLLYTLQEILAPSWDLVYEPSLAAWWSPARLAAAAAALAVLAVCVVRRRREMRTAVIFWPAWFLVTLLPTANLLRQEVPFADRWTHLSSLAIVGLLAACVSLSRGRPWARVLAWSGGATLLAACAVVSAHRCSFFQDGATFCRQWLRTDPASLNAHAHLGYLLFRDKRYDDAIEQFSLALRGHPDYDVLHDQLGRCYRQKGDLAKAASAFSEAVRLNPRSVPARYGRADLSLVQGERDAAVLGFREVLRLDPKHVPALYNLGVLLEQAGDTQEARTLYAQCLKLEPRHAQAHANLANLLARAGALEDAMRHYRESLLLQPDNPRAHGNFANALVRAGKLEAALEHYQDVLRLEPRSVEARFNSGLLLSRLGRIPEAVAHYDQALALAPDSPGAAHNLAWILATQEDGRLRQPDRALVLAERVCRRTDATHPVALDTLAAAYAAGGRFKEAVETARAALREAEAEGSRDLAGQIRRRLELYDKGRPYHEVVVSVR